VKKTFLIVVSLIAITTFAFAGGDQNQKRHDGELGQGPTNQVRIDNQNKDALQTTQLTDEQQEIIYGIYEEEKLARDVYRTLGELYSEENTFSNIQLSEQTHMDAVKKLCDKYDIEIIVSDETGNFSIQELQEFFNAVYEKFVTNEEGSLLEALEVGREIELMDIEDLTEALQTDMPRDVQRVFNNLMIGSGYHLDAFTSAIDRETSQ